MNTEDFVTGHHHYSEPPSMKIAHSNRGIHSLPHAKHRSRSEARIDSDGDDNDGRIDDGTNWKPWPAAPPQSTKIFQLDSYTRKSLKTRSPPIVSAKDVIASLCAKAFAVEQAHREVASETTLKAANSSRRNEDEIRRAAAPSVTNLNEAIESISPKKTPGLIQSDWMTQLRQRDDTTNTTDDNKHFQVPNMRNHDANICYRALRHGLVRTQPNYECCYSTASQSQSSNTDDSSQGSTTGCSGNGVDDVIADLVSKASRVAILSQAAPAPLVFDRYVHNVEQPNSKSEQFEVNDSFWGRTFENGHQIIPENSEPCHDALSEQLFQPMFLFRRFEEPEQRPLEFVPESIDEENTHSAVEHLSRPLFRYENQILLRDDPLHVSPSVGVDTVDTTLEESWDNILLPLVATTCAPDEISSIEMQIPLEIVNTTQGRISPMSVPSMMSDCESKDYTSSDDNCGYHNGCLAEKCLAARGRRRRKWRIYR